MLHQQKSRGFARVKVENAKKASGQHFYRVQHQGWQNRLAVAALTIVRLQSDTDPCLGTPFFVTLVR